MALADLFARLRSEWSDMQGHLDTLTGCVRDTNAQVVVELGVRTGVSTAAFLHALGDTGGRLWSCDVETPDVPREVAGAAHWTLVVGNDLDVAELAPRPIDVLFVDTVHTYEHTMAELALYAPLVRPGGYVLAHDTQSHPDVARALDDFFGVGAWENHPASFGLGVMRVGSSGRESQTLVTCLFDLERRERIGRRPVEFYKANGGYVLGLDQPLVLFVDPELELWARHSREERGLGELTVVVARPLEELELGALVPLVASLPSIANGHPLKDTPHHHVVGWSKLDLIADAMALDPFATDHFAWIDFGIGHIARQPDSFPAPSKRVAALQMRAVAPAELDDKREFLRYERGRVAAGFLRGHRSAIRRLREAFRAELASVLALPLRASEQAILSYLGATNADLFDFYFGDYASILSNWDYVRHDVDTVLRNVAHCREMQLWREGLLVCDALRASQRAGALEIGDERRAQLLAEEFVLALNAGHRLRAEASRAEFLSLCADTAYYRRELQRVDANFSLLPEHHDGPAVSAIIPVHNGEATLERAIRSVLGQTVEDVEVVVVDDASTDGSVVVALRLAAEDRRVKVVTRDAPSGSPATPRDDGIAVSSGRFVALLDQDDYWLPDKLARQLPLFDRPDVAVVYSDARHEDRYGTFRSAADLGLQLPEGDIHAELVVHDVVPAPTAVISREWVERTGRFDHYHLVGTDDYFYWLRISLAGGKFAVVREPTAVHTWRRDSLGESRSVDVFESWHRLFAALAEDFPHRTAEFPARHYLPCVPEGDGLRRATIALCMIVRDESAVIERCIGSVRHLLTHWVIVDTGSRDDTADRVLASLEGIPGTLHHRPWRDFAANRSELMDLAHGVADYLLLLDADMTLEQTGPLPPLRLDAYLLPTAGPLVYAVARLVRGDRRWWYKGSAHEYLAGDHYTTEVVSGLVVHHHADGGSRFDKLERDLRLLDRDLASRPDDERAVFYLAQTQRDLGNNRAALELFRRRAGMGGWEEEAFYAAYQAAVLLAAEDPDAGFAALLRAWQRRPSRAEPLYDAAVVARNHRWWDLAYLVARQGSAIRPPNDILFVHRWVYDWGLELEHSIAAWWTGRVDECLAASERLLERPDLPADVVAAAHSNRRLCQGRSEPSSVAAGALPRLEHLVPTARWARIILDVDPRWPAFNPTICADGDGFRAIVRTANYEIVDGRYHYLDGSTDVRTLNYVVRLDGSLRVGDVRPLIDGAPRARHSSQVLGYEDCRLVRWQERWVATATVRDANPGMWCEVALLVIEDDTVAEAHILDRPRPDRHEKNWMPYVAGGELRLVYSCDPLRLFAWAQHQGLRPLTVAPSGEEDVRWRGGTGGVALERDKTLFLVHELVNGHRLYAHRWVLLDDAAVAAVSPPFTFTGAAVEYAAGMALRGDDLVVSFGIGDRVAALAIVPLAAVLGQLKATAGGRR